VGEGRVVAVGRSDNGQQGQARAATEQGVDAIAPQQRAGVVVRGVADGRVGVAPPPGQDRGAVDDEVAPTDEAAVSGEPDQDHQQRLTGRCTGLRRTAALLGGAGYDRPTSRVGGEPTGEGQRGPRHQPVVQILVRQAPGRAQQRQQEQRLLAVAPRAPTKTGGQGRGTTSSSEADRHSAQGQEVQRAHQGERVDLQARPQPLLCPMVGWGAGPVPGRTTGQASWS
jgi:hypothetical protein